MSSSLHPALYGCFLRVGKIACVDHNATDEGADAAWESVEGAEALLNPDSKTGGKIPG